MLGTVLDAGGLHREQNKDLALTEWRETDK